MPDNFESYIRVEIKLIRFFMPTDLEYSDYSRDLISDAALAKKPLHRENQRSCALFRNPATQLDAPALKTSA
jgi:hypothetical protein